MDCPNAKESQEELYSIEKPLSFMEAFFILEYLEDRTEESP
jgi:hypothetical protein